MLSFGVSCGSSFIRFLATIVSATTGRLPSLVFCRTRSAKYYQRTNKCCFSVPIDSLWDSPPIPPSSMSDSPVPPIRSMKYKYIHESDLTQQILSMMNGMRDEPNLSD
ncbi:hypothetical protein EDB89DRAFT_1945660 [Lactarius sanguifluus]|nr:hypothetical protein EDB89DRAFT_1945660 [Lactarius sanguifluus]